MTLDNSLLFVDTIPASNGQSLCHPFSQDRLGTNPLSYPRVPSASLLALAAWLWHPQTALFSIDWSLMFSLSCPQTLDSQDVRWSIDILLNARRTGAT
ncbi:hypothetical protein IFM53868_02058 [Aspergillus udagawae]|uniref:Uncharacterized protein n=1 Tax=Aspergillus udagawae TaxID=91492 RepID=A0ABQ1AA86_9EURO|nr:hypothetical protein IFM53868_02058 [Aspergillus udagawae]